MNTFNIKQAAIKRVEEVTGKCIDITNPRHTEMVQSFIAGASYMITTPVAIAGQKYEVLVRTVCTYYEKSLAEMAIKNREQGILIPRQMLCYLLFTTGNLGKSTIGKIMNQDHTTVINAIKRIETALQTNDRVKSDYKAIMKLLSKTATKD